MRAVANRCQADGMGPRCVHVGAPAQVPSSPRARLLGPRRPRRGASPMRVDMTDTNDRPRAELQDALASLASIVLGDAPLHDVLTEVATIAADLVPGAETVSVTLLDADGGAHTEASSGPLALTLDQSQYDTAEGPCLHAARTRTVVVIDEMASEERWSDYCAAAAAK